MNDIPEFHGNPNDLDWNPEYVFKLKSDLEQANNKLADLQRLCERALLCLSEHWNDLTDSEGYGYTSLESALKKASAGKEYKDITLLTNKLIKFNQEKEGELETANNSIKILAEALGEAANCLDMTGEAHPRTGDWIEIANQYKEKAG